jgi:drug/metabolite transporter superfamily protein YnfA
MTPLKFFPILIILSLLTVEIGGAALLRMLTRDSDTSDFREQFFRAGHAHAGVLLILSLVYFLYLDRTELSEQWQWIAGGALALGVLAQSGGFFLHLALGEPSRASAGTALTISGGLLIAAALIILAVRLIRA